MSRGSSPKSPALTPMPIKAAPHFLDTGYIHEGVDGGICRRLEVPGWINRINAFISGGHLKDGEELYVEVRCLQGAVWIPREGAPTYDAITRVIIGRAGRFGNGWESDTDEPKYFATQASRPTLWAIGLDLHKMRFCAPEQAVGRRIQALFTI